MDERQLIKSCIVGDRRAQKALYDMYSRQMMGVCLRYVKEMETARDVLQEGFLCLFNSLPSYLGRGSFNGWVRRIFVNCALNHLRKKDLLQEADVLETDVGEDIAEDEDGACLSAEEIWVFVLRLPERYRTVFNLFVVEGYSHREIGEMLDMKEATSRSVYLRARKSLQKMINGSRKN